MKKANGTRRAALWVGILVGICTISSFFFGRVSAIEERAANAQRTQDRIESMEKESALLKSNVVVSEDALQKNLNSVVLQQQQIQTVQGELGRKMIHLTDEVTRSNAQAYELARTNERMRLLTQRMDALTERVTSLAQVVQAHSDVVESLTKRIKKKLDSGTPPAAP